MQGADFKDVRLATMSGATWENAGTGVKGEVRPMGLRSSPSVHGVANMTSLKSAYDLIDLEPNHDLTRSSHDS